MFVASDVSKKVKKAVKDTLAVAVDPGVVRAIRILGPGEDRAAAEELASAFCRRRVARGHMTRRDCLRDSTKKDHGFLTYQEIGAKAWQRARAPKGVPVTTGGRSGASTG
ncbi:MAG: hypothetical protein Ct9H300mP1_07350 [Planctomycetaceae bacterium]|nr:MAG: hypothetical protein Ct9H300mP1_07350 [Planctomycetaceae bacterium]